MEEARKIGIMSDSHDNLPAIRAAVELFNAQQVDFVIHAGDLVAPFTAREIKKLTCPYQIVLGNNDGEILGLFKVFDGNVNQPPFQIKINNRTIFVLHDPVLISEIKESCSFDLIIYGHDHISSVQRLKDETLIVNPGECGGWLSGKSTVAIYDTVAHQVEIFELKI